jgi:hypothetical protein
MTALGSGLSFTILAKIGGNCRLGNLLATDFRSSII